MDSNGLIALVEKWSVTDKLAAAALGVATISLLLSAIPALTSIFAAIAAWQTHKAERRGAEPAINASILRPEGWPEGYTTLVLSVTNDSVFFIEMRRVKLIAPRGLRIAFAPVSELQGGRTPPPSYEGLLYARKVETGATLVRPKGLPNPNKKDLRFALKSQLGRGDTTLRMKVYYARHNRDLRSTMVPIHVVVHEGQWRD